MFDEVHVIDVWWVAEVACASGKCWQHCWRWYQLLLSHFVKFFWSFRLQSEPNVLTIWLNTCACFCGMHTSVFYLLGKSKTGSPWHSTSILGKFSCWSAAYRKLVLIIIKNNNTIQAFPIKYGPWVEMHPWKDWANFTIGYQPGINPLEFGAEFLSKENLGKRGSWLKIYDREIYPIVCSLDAIKEQFSSIYVYLERI